MKTIASLFLALCLTCGTLCQCLLDQCHASCEEHQTITPLCVGEDDPEW